MATLLLIREMIYCSDVIADPDLPDTKGSCVSDYMLVRQFVVALDKK